MTTLDAPCVAMLDVGIIDGLMMRDPDAFTLLTYLYRHHHWDSEFTIADDLCSAMPGCWRRQRFIAARARLIEGGYLVIVQEPMMCRLSHRWMLMEEA